MGWNETKLTLIGRICSDITTRTTTDGLVMADFRLAANERRYDRDTQTWITSGSLFVTVKCFKRAAERVSATLAKGDPVVAVGRVYTRTYELDGERRQELEMEAYGIGPDLSLCAVSVERPAQVTSVAA
jgi:single-strand DNA-binding protein